MPWFWTFVSQLPIGSYSVSQDFRHRRTIAFLGLYSVVVFAALTAWNVATQGRNTAYNTVFLQQFVHNSSTTCQSAHINVGDTFFMYPFGNFSWVLNGVDRGQGFETGFSYSGSELQDVKVTSVGLTYEFNSQNYNYGICANGSVVSSSNVFSNNTRGASETNIILSFCTNYDLQVANLPHWTDVAKQRIENAIYVLPQYWQNLTFPNHTFPDALIPPYGQPGPPPPKDTTVTPANVVDLNIWMLGYAYLPLAKPNENAKLGDNHTLIANGTTHTLAETFELANSFTALPLQGGIGFTVDGVGNIHMGTAKSNKNINFTEPAVITGMRDYSLSLTNLLMDMAVQDIHDVSIAVSYLCSVSSQQWKAPLSMIAMILGNNAALFSVALAFMIAVAKWHDIRQREKVLRSTIAQDVEARPVVPIQLTYTNRSNTADSDNISEKQVETPSSTSKYHEDEIQPAE